MYNFVSEFSERVKNAVWKTSKKNDQDGEINEDGITQFSPQTRIELDMNDTDCVEAIKQEPKKDEKNDLLKQELDKMKEELNKLKEESDKVKKESGKVKEEFDKVKEESYKVKKESGKLKEEFDKVKGESNRVKKESGKVKEELNKSRQKLEGELKETKRLEAKLRDYEKEKQELDSKLKALEDKANHYQQNCNELKRSNDELVSQKHNMEQVMETNIGNLEQQMKEQRRNFEKGFKQAQETYKKSINDLRQKLDEKGLKGGGLRELEEKNAKLKEEASKYQSALGVATNIRLGDDDQNHSVKLKHDISILQNTLEDYVTHLKPNIDIDIERVRNLAQDYGCLNEITVENPNKLFIKAILQRKVLGTVFYYSQELSKYRDEDFALELNIESKAQELLKLIEKFSTTRVGTDQVIGTAAIKIRQQVYGILGNRGFNDIIHPDGNIYVHNLIHFAGNELNKMMNQYRRINDIDRKKQVEAMAPKLIQDIYKLFWFRVNVQEPTTEAHFFNFDDKIDPDTMKGMWNDDEIDRLYVDVCYFPLVGRNLASSNRKIYTPARVFPRN